MSEERYKQWQVECEHRLEELYGVETVRKAREAQRAFHAERKRCARDEFPPGL